MKKLLYLLTVTFLLSCGSENAAPPTTPPAVQEANADDTVKTIVYAVNRCARLYTTEYRIHKIVTYSDEPVIEGRVIGIPVKLPARIGDRKAIVPIDVTLKAYVDLEKFDERNVSRTDSTIILTLPDPTILATASKVDHAATRTFVDPLRSAFSDKELSDLARQGVDSVLSHTGRFGIIEQARNHAATTLVPLLRRMGYREEKIIVRFGKDYSDEDLRHITVTRN